MALCVSCEAIAATRTKPNPERTMNATRTIEIRGLEHPTARDALVELNFSGDRAISLGGRYFTIDEAEYRRLQDMGIQPTTWHHHEATGRLMSVPGNTY
jgi:hypothetical protein